MLNRVVSLRDRWRKIATARAGEGDGGAKTLEARRVQRRRHKQAQQRASRERARKPEQIPAPTPALAAKRVHFERALGLSPREAALLTRSAEMAQLFERALTGGPSAAALARWLTNTVAAEIKRRGAAALCAQAEAIGRLVAMNERGETPGPVAKRILARMLDRGESPEAIIAREGLGRQIDDEALRSLIAELCAREHEAFERLRGGETRLFGFFIGQLMRQTGGKAEPGRVRALLEEALGA